MKRKKLLHPLVAIPPMKLLYWNLLPFLFSFLWAAQLPDARHACTVLLKQTDSLTRLHVHNKYRAEKSIFSQVSQLSRDKKSIYGCLPELHLDR
jgi:hypothetical protein